MDIVLVGSGNVAHVLGHRARRAGYRIRQVVSRRSTSARELALGLEAESGGLQQIMQGSFFYILAVSDSALPELARWMRLEQGVVVHTSGTVSMDVLKDVSMNRGVLWPLQSLRKESVDVAEIPLVINANTPETLTLLQDFATSIGSVMALAGDEQRRKLHLAAVVAGNFSNHLFALVDEYCRKESLDFHLLIPMLRETVNRLNVQDPSGMQTGPAARNDLATINTHLEMLKDEEALRKVYELMTGSIRNKMKQP
jgi:predicted short-subunit dehydrogenase-like oxidoreductase (DUF2520 family)